MHRAAALVGGPPCLRRRRRARQGRAGLEGRHGCGRAAPARRECDSRDGAGRQVGSTPEAEEGGDDGGLAGWLDPPDAPGAPPPRYVASPAGLFPACYPPQVPPPSSAQEGRGGAGRLPRRPAALGCGRYASARHPARGSIIRCPCLARLAAAAPLTAPLASQAPSAHRRTRPAPARTGPHRPTPARTGPHRPAPARTAGHRPARHVTPPPSTGEGGGPCPHRCVSLRAPPAAAPSRRSLASCRRVPGESKAARRARAGDTWAGRECLCGWWSASGWWGG